MPGTVFSGTFCLSLLQDQRAASVVSNDYSYLILEIRLCHERDGFNGSSVVISCTPTEVYRCREGDSGYNQCATGYNDAHVVHSSLLGVLVFNHQHPLRRARAQLFLTQKSPTGQTKILDIVGNRQKSLSGESHFEIEPRVFRRNIMS